ncbi:FHA domain-containing protein [Candidatus Magnetomonas plexicatena]|uniref:FHA domain-containing protein n=1 Tax=Candidatus Magnetomonas plexicatena TaxID=2552947 RepID=UPI001C793FC8|nr:FHA domain-containing protein [Nitrospirales bacterium LBB_01]
MNKAITFAGLTDKGLVRQRNEDNLSMNPEHGMFIVSDGMGGHAAGDLASKEVVENLPGLLIKYMQHIASLKGPDAVETISSALTELNEHVRIISKSKPGLSGMGATVVLLIIKNREAIVAHMGDSRAYLLRHGSLTQLTMDHSVIQVLINSGEITQADIQSHPARGKITRCIGMSGDALPETKFMVPQPGDRFLLCSDGLTGMVGDSDIKETLMNIADSEKACASLIKSAITAGGIDNITVIVVDYVLNDDSDSDVTPVTISDTEKYGSGEKDTAETTDFAALVVNLDKTPPQFSLPVTAPSFTIGRSSNNNLSLKVDKTVSRNHCVVRVEGGELILEDLGSRNGTYLNGKRIKGAVSLPLPSWFAVGRTRIGIIPPGSDEAQADDLLDEAYSSEGSILIPPSEFFEERTEALLVVDIVGSTRIVKLGETHLVKVISALGQLLEKSLQNEKHAFLKCTGDGFFAIFSSADAALSAALKLSPGILRHIKIPVQISIALHWGSVRLTQEGERTGRNAHAVFSLEDLRHREPKVNERLTPHHKEFILMTDPFWSNLNPASQLKALPIGSYTLKGLDKQEKIYYWKTQ